mmetsp:Transcript_6654/g.14489  ORF Transcript_6654/g.14489 Transcript_6654/m.14489 type:complete len:221 (-) Transcript_6654:387-1049(-)
MAVPPLPPQGSRAWARRAGTCATRSQSVMGLAQEATSCAGICRGGVCELRPGRAEERAGQRTSRPALPDQARTTWKRTAFRTGWPSPTPSPRITCPSEAGPGRPARWTRWCTATSGGGGRCPGTGGPSRLSRRAGWRRRARCSSTSIPWGGTVTRTRTRQYQRRLRQPPARLERSKACERDSTIQFCQMTFGRRGGTCPKAPALSHHYARKGFPDQIMRH